MSMNSSAVVEAIEHEALRIEEDCTYSSKAHYNAAATWSHMHLWIGIPTALLAAAASASAFGDREMIAGFIGIAVTALTAIATFLDPSGKANSHRGAAHHYLSLRNSARVFREIEVKDGEPESLKKRLYELAAHRNSLNESSPRIPQRAFLEARRGIEAGESTHAVDSLPTKDDK